MKVFITAVDRPLGHNIARIFSNSKPGATLKNSDEELEENTETQPNKEVSVYNVVGTMSSNQTQYSVSKPGTMHYSGIQKRDALRKEALQKFNIAGVKPTWVSHIFDASKKQEYMDAILSSDVIVFDLINYFNEAQEAIEELAKHQADFKNPKVFIGISSVMTWTRTVVDPDDPESNFTELDYKRRRAHLDYKKHVEVERMILKLGKRDNLKSFIINCGLLLHPADNILHMMFKDAWDLKPVTVYGNGENIIPFSHVDDVSNAVLYTAEVQPAQRYILAVDEAGNSMHDVAKAISSELGVGAVKVEDVTNLLLNKSVSKFEYDLMRVNLRVAPGQIKDLGFDPKYTTGVVENIKKLVKEYRNARGFHPLKVMILGPPGTGKSTLAVKLGEYSSIPVFSVDSIMSDFVRKLENQVEAGNEEEAAEAKRNLDDVNEYRSNNNDQFSRDQIIRNVRQRILAKDCRNQGYILDGYYLSQEDLTEIFKAEDDALDEDDGEIDPLSFDLAPEFAVVLEASDDFICKRVMSLPETELVTAPFSEEAFLKKLALYRANNTEDKSILNYLDELEIHPHLFSAEDQLSLFDRVVEFVGEPRNYGLSFDELEKFAKIENEKQKLALESENEQKKAEGRQELLRQQKEAIELEKKLLLIKEQEEQAIEVQSVPLREYLMLHIMPTLTAGLVQVCKARPEDPIDYLAEYLFSAQVNSSEVDSQEI